MSKNPNRDFFYNPGTPTVCRQLICRIPNSSTGAVGCHIAPILQMEMLRLREFGGLVQDYARPVGTNGRATLLRGLSPATSAAARELSLKQEQHKSVSRQPVPFGFHAPHMAVSCYVTSKCHAPLHLPLAVCVHVGAHASVRKHTQFVVSLTSQRGHSTPWATHGAPLPTFNRLIQKQIFEVYQT